MLIFVLMKTLAHEHQLVYRVLSPLNVYSLTEKDFLSEKLLIAGTQYSLHI
jgi:replication initiation and membrane attachment protein DnaB